MARQPRKPVENPLERFKREKGLTDQQVGTQLGLAREQVQRLRSGTRGPSLRTALRIQDRTGGAIPVEAWGGIA